MSSFEESKYLEVAAPARRALDGSEITLRDIVRVLFRRWVIVAAVVLVAMGVTTLYMASTKPRYAIEAVVTQRSDIDRQHSANTIGLSLLGTQPVVNDTFLQFLAMLHAPETVATLPDRDAVIRTIFARNWDAERKVWVPPSGLLSRALAALNGIFGIPAWKPPTVQDVAEFLQRSIQTESADRTTLYNIRFEWPDPQFAKAFITDLISSADAQIRSRMAAEYAEQAKYIAAQLDQTENMQVRQDLAGMLADTVLSEATLYDRDTYSVKVVQPPTASAYPVSPRPVLYLFLAALIGAFLGGLLVLALAIGRGLPE